MNFGDAHQVVLLQVRKKFGEGIAMPLSVDVIPEDNPNDYRVAFLFVEPLYRLTEDDSLCQVRGRRSVKSQVVKWKEHEGVHIGLSDAYRRTFHEISLTLRAIHHSGLNYSDVRNNVLWGVDGKVKLYNLGESMQVTNKLKNTDFMGFGSLIQDFLVEQMSCEVVKTYLKMILDHGLRKVALIFWSNYVKKVFVESLALIVRNNPKLLATENIILHSFRSSTEHVCNDLCLPRLYETALRLGELQPQFKLPIDPQEYAQENLKFGLVEVVYEWAKVRKPALISTASPRELPSACCTLKYVRQGVDLSNDTLHFGKFVQKF
ncbi:hypothetical protein RND71_019254 [Anisodus tanguticus]|uniref:Uncharacterized protein n=1 Tax=Anisodus tanguticus TaxID=243964 RepID=A0AAE1S064_9SOLA|nr:hypothetical protein RND71_019254 [Anisodus tanguticus]